MRKRTPTSEERAKGLESGHEEQWSGMDLEVWNNFVLAGNDRFIQYCSVEFRRTMSTDKNLQHGWDADFAGDVITRRFNIRIGDTSWKTLHQNLQGSPRTDRTSHQARVSSTLVCETRSCINWNAIIDGRLEIGCETHCTVTRTLIRSARIRESGMDLEDRDMLQTDSCGPQDKVSKGELGKTK